LTLNTLKGSHLKIQLILALKLEKKTKKQKHIFSNTHFFKINMFFPPRFQDHFLPEYTGYFYHFYYSKNCEDLLRVFNPVANALNRMQRNTTSEAVEVWINLLEKVTREVGGREAVIQRSKQALKCQFFLLANVLCPRFAGTCLTPSQLDKARQFSEEEGPEVALALKLYLARAPPFRQVMFQPNADPKAFWHAGQLSGFPAELCSLALRLCGCRINSPFGTRATMSHVYGQERNALGAEACKLTFLFRSLNSAQVSDKLDSDTD